MVVVVVERAPATAWFSDVSVVVFSVVVVIIVVLIIVTLSFGVVVIEKTVEVRGTVTEDVEEY